MALFRGMPGVGAAIALSALPRTPLATPVAEAVGVFDPLGTAAGSVFEVALPTCVLCVLGTAKATLRV